MAKLTLTIIDTAGIQPYIFGSNRLQENIGASELVRLATGQWALEAAMVGAANHHNISDAKAGALDPDYRIEDDPDDTSREVLYAGGGNVVILFRSPASAREFAYTLTRRALQDAPGLSIVVAHEDDFDWNSDALSKKLRVLIHSRLAEQKAARPLSMPLLGLGVTAACESTGLVAAQTNEKLKGKEEETRLISRETAAKLGARDKANNRLNRLFAGQLEKWYEFPSDIDNLSRALGEESYVGVVHADGNNMGKHIDELLGQLESPSDNRRLIERLRSFSQKVDEAAAAALCHIVRMLTFNIRVDVATGKEWIAGELEIKDHYLPFRPLVFGGDDVTFICNAKLGLSLAAAYLEAFERETAKRGLADFHACAGIAMVKMHYPFARAYELSEQLVASAKQYVRYKYKLKGDASAMDWHFAVSGLNGPLAMIRNLEYSPQSPNSPEQRKLLMRPVLLRPESGDQDGRAWWQRIEKLIVTFQQDAEWSNKRNKVKGLMDALRDGPTSVKHYLLAHEIKQLPEILPGQETYRADGHDVGGRCGYFDAIEMLDHYSRLEEAG